MNINDLVFFLQTNGYNLVKTNVNQMRVLEKKDETINEVKIVLVVNNVGKKEFDVKQLDNIVFQLERRYLLTGYRNVEVICWVITDNLERDKEFGILKYNCWMIDTLIKRLVIYENGSYDFDGLRDLLEQHITEKSARKTYGTIKKQKTPIVTLSLIIVNIIIFVLMEVKGYTSTEFLLKYGASYWPYIFEKNEYYRFLTSMFIHMGFAHIANNMLSLWILGFDSERFYGKINYLIIYIAGGLCGSVTSAVYYMIKGENVVSAGASGAISAVLGSVVIMMLIKSKSRKSKGLTRAILVLLLITVGNGTTSGVDNMAHLGGFVGGLVLSIIIYQIKSARKR